MLFLLSYRYIRAIEEAFSPFLAAYFLMLMCSLCFSSYTSVLVIERATHTKPVLIFLADN
jgi:hypothetical protein